MNFLFFIPARKNSKGIKNKNLSLVKSKPLIYHTLKFVKNFIKQNKGNDNFYSLVSSDSKKILNFCRDQGFESDYIRPKKLSQDSTTMIETVVHGLNWLNKNENFRIDAVIILQPTTPYRLINEFEKMIFKFKKIKSKSMISVTNVKEHPYEIIKKFNNKWNFLVKPKNKVRGRQDYKNNYFFVDGSYYIIDSKFLLAKNKIIIQSYTNLFLLDRTWPIDIDVMDDLRIAEIFL